MSKIRGKKSLECGRMHIWALKTQKLPGPLSRAWTPAANCSLRCVGNFRPQHLGPPLDQILDPHLKLIMHCFVIIDCKGKMTKTYRKNHSRKLRLKVASLECLAAYLQTCQLFFTSRWRQQVYLFKQYTLKICSYLLYSTLTINKHSFDTFTPLGLSRSHEFHTYV